MADTKKILSQMTTLEKIGQLMQYNANLFVDTEAEITGPMEVYNFTKEQVRAVGSCLNFRDASEMIKIQEQHLEHDRNKIPVIFMMDVIHGYRTIYPIPLAMGCSFDPELMKECARISAEEAAAGGVHVTFNPMVDYVRDARWGRVMETCGEDVGLNCKMGAAQVEGFQGDDLSKVGNLATCVKHFAAYGGAEAGRDYNTVELSEHVLREYYLPAYKACIDAGTKMIMPSFNTLNGVPATVNPWLMKTILKDEWKFDGVVISDYAAIHELAKHGITNDPKEQAYLAFKCGCDIEMCSTTYAHNLEKLIEEGRITMEELDAAVLRVLNLKNELGLFEDPLKGVDIERENAISLCDEHRAVARKAAEQTAVLLKNEGVLPFSKSLKKIAVIGPLGNDHEILGFWKCNGINDESVTVYEGIKNLLPNAEITVVNGCSKMPNELDKSGFNEAIEAARNADAVLLCLGENQNHSGEGNSRTSLDLPGVQGELAEAVAAVNPNCAAVTFSGRPLSLSNINKTVPAILHMWMPGNEGGNAVANLIFGDANPCGKLSMCFPYSVGQCPIYYNHAQTGRPKAAKFNFVHKAYCSNYVDGPNLPLFSFGHGLSYSNFVYEGMTLSANEMTADSTIEVAITVKNDSDIAGKEVVQLYMRDLFASNTRPIQQLIDFKKVDFAANETKVIKFTVKEEMLRFWNNEHKFVSEPGEFELYTGYADHLIHTNKFILK